MRAVIIFPVVQNAFSKKQQYEQYETRNQLQAVKPTADQFQSESSGQQRCLRPANF
jgi:hypothetical protein